ncbi:uncharacterized protein LOC126883744 [Diabrotica virgifera virgifera]|uniref:CCHC-type domain-containing protein n=1 Tax=Diabrotica virgifera virgifera TaxID=50390 RepID=A0ABM5K598_DIAVI|nr:uncharacterized protein LOC126883744 [Diabrotica virgifera virgifera]
MEKYFRPDKLEADPNSQTAAKEFKHWYETFKNFLESNKSTEKSLEDKDKHILATRKQQINESIDQYAQQLKLLAKNCNFKAVSSEENKNDYIRDAFINGLVQSNIRQRLLEFSSLSLDEALSKSRSLEDSQKQSDTYHAALNNIASCSHPNSEQTTLASVQTKPGQTCYFCGHPRHPRSVCPARAAICQNCHKIGHWFKMCMQSKKSQTRSTYASTMVIASSMETPQSLSKCIAKVTVNRIDANALIDTGSSDTFLDHEFAIENKLKIFPIQGVQVSMASMSFSANIQGYCLINIQVDKEKYDQTKVLVLSNLCTDVILGQDIMKQHESLEVKFGGPRRPLKICCLTEAKIKPTLLLQLFNLVPVW